MSRSRTLHPRLALERYISMEGVMAAKAKASKREEIDTGKDKRYVRRNEKGQLMTRSMSGARLVGT